MFSLFSLINLIGLTVVFSMNCICPKYLFFNFFYKYISGLLSLKFKLIIGSVSALSFGIQPMPIVLSHRYVCNATFFSFAVNCKYVSIKNSCRGGNFFPSTNQQVDLSYVISLMQKWIKRVGRLLKCIFNADKLLNGFMQKIRILI